MGGVDGHIACDRPPKEGELDRPNTEEPDSDELQVSCIYILQ